jgi:hypothetical protein
MSFVADVFASAWRAFRRPVVWIPAALLSLAADAIVHSLHWPSTDAEPPPTQRVIVTFALVILGQAWFALTVTNVALAVLRGQRAGFLRQWVHVIRALEIGLVTLVLLVPIALGTLLLIVPGVYLVLLWSQVVLVIIDDQARLFAAANWSASLTDGYRLQILGVWLVVWIISSLAPVPIVAMGDLDVPWAAGLSLGASWAWNAITHTFGIALAAALYLELSRRAPWKPEQLRTRL